MLLSTTTSVLALFGIGQVLAAPQYDSAYHPTPSPSYAPGACDVKDYDSFKLYGTRDDTGEKYPVRLYRVDPHSDDLSSYAIINTSKAEPKIYPCYTCGIIPDSWTLKRGSLVPLDRTLPDDHTTVNLDVEEYGKLNFIAQVGGSADYPVYCASSPPGAYDVRYLGVHGNYKDFVMCRDESSYNPRSIYEIVYKYPQVTKPGYKCVPVTLTVESYYD